MPYFDRNNGDDNLGDGSQGNPWRTITKARTYGQQAGDIIFLKRGDDYSSDTPGTNGLLEFAANNIQVRMWGNAAAPRPSLRCLTKPGIFIGGRDAIDIEGFECGSSTTASINGITFFDNCNNCRIADFIISDTMYSGIGSAGTQLGGGHVIEDGSISYAGNDGVNFQNSIGNASPIICRRLNITRPGYKTNNAGSGLAIGEGDGISVHATAKIIAYDCYFGFCAKGGFVHASTAGGQATAYRCFFEECVQGGAFSSGGSLIVYNCIFRSPVTLGVGGSVPSAIKAATSCQVEAYLNTIDVRLSGWQGMSNRNTASGAGSTWKGNLLRYANAAGLFTSIDVVNGGTVTFDYNSYSHGTSETIFQAPGNKNFANWKATDLPDASGIGANPLNNPDANGAVHGDQLSGSDLVFASDAKLKRSSGARLFVPAAQFPGYTDMSLDYFKRQRTGTVWDAGAIAFFQPKGLLKRIGLG